MRQSFANYNFRVASAVCFRGRKRGFGLLQTITAIGVSATLLALCIPLFLEGPRQADYGLVRAGIDAEARELSSRLREDIRQAQSTAIADGGATLRIACVRVSAAPGSVFYRRSARGWTRERPAPGGKPVERFEYEPPLERIQFQGRGREVRAVLSFSRHVHRRTLTQTLEVSAVPQKKL